MLHQTFLFLGQLWQLFEVSQILEFLRYKLSETILYVNFCFHKNNRNVLFQG